MGLALTFAIRTVGNAATAQEQWHGRKSSGTERASRIASRTHLFVKKLLQDDLGGDSVSAGFVFFVGEVAGLEEFVGGGGGEAFVLEVHALFREAFEFASESADQFGLGAFAVVHVQG